MSFPRLTIYDTPPELYHVALLGYQAVSTYGYEGRKGYTFYFYNKYKTVVRKNLTGWSVKVVEVPSKIINNKA